ncbi:MAG: hypothetical protein WCI11_19795 [Candidatus Methylumidiphilus sp.]
MLIKRLICSEYGYALNCWFENTALSGASPPEASAVYLGKPPFDGKKPDWKAMERLAVDIPEGTDRDEFLKRIKQAETKGNDPATLAALSHDPGAVYRELLPTICAVNQSKSRRAAVRGIRRNYQNYQRGKELNDDPEFPKTLTEIDRTLCQNPACADLKNDIDGLDCSQFDKTKPQPAESKANNPFTP